MDSINLIRNFLEQRLDVTPDKVTTEARLEELGVDSLMLLELMFEFEDKFGITLDNTLQTPKNCRRDGRDDGATAQRKRLGHGSAPCSHYWAGTGKPLRR